MASRDARKLVLDLLALICVASRRRSRALLKAAMRGVPAVEGLRISSRLTDWKSTWSFLKRPFTCKHHGARLGLLRPQAFQSKIAKGGPEPHLAAERAVALSIDHHWIFLVLLLDLLNLHKREVMSQAKQMHHDIASRTTSA